MCEEKVICMSNAKPPGLLQLTLNKLNESDSQLDTRGSWLTHTHSPCKELYKHNHPTHTFHTEKLLRNLLPSCSPSPAFIFLVNLYKFSYFGSFVAGLPLPKPTYLSLDALRKDMLSGAKDSEQRECLFCNHRQLELLSSPPDWRALGATPWLILCTLKFPGLGLGLSKLLMDLLGLHIPTAPQGFCSLHPVVVQSPNHVPLFTTLLTAAHQVSLSLPHCIPDFAQVHVHWIVRPSSHLILCRPLLLLPSVFPSIRVFSNESAVCIRWPKYWSFSFSISPSRVLRLISFRIDWFDLLAV